MEGIIILFVVAHFIAWIVALGWVYGDAEERGQSGCLMALLVFFAGWVGIVIWVVLRKDLGPGDLDQYQTPRAPSYTPVARETLGKSFYKILNEDYWLWKNDDITQEDFLERKAAAIEELRGKRAEVNEFLGEMIPFVESGILTRDDIDKIRTLLTGTYSNQETNAQHDLPIVEMDNSTLLELYRESGTKEIADELKRRGLHQLL